MHLTHNPKAGCSRRVTYQGSDTLELVSKRRISQLYVELTVEQRLNGVSIHYYIL